MNEKKSVKNTQSVIIGRSIYFAPLLAGSIAVFYYAFVLVLKPSNIAVPGSIFLFWALLVAFTTRLVYQKINKYIGMKGAKLLEIHRVLPLAKNMPNYEIVYQDRKGKVFRAYCKTAVFLSPVYLTEEKIIGNEESGEYYFRGKFHKL